MAVSERYDQPFCIIGNERLQKRWRRTHLPPLEPPPGYYGWGYATPKEEAEDVPRIMEGDTVARMQGQILYLMNKVHERAKAGTERFKGV